MDKLKKIEKLTKVQRHDLYSVALKDMEFDFNVMGTIGSMRGGGLCWYLGHKEQNVNITNKTYPEIFKHRPETFKKGDDWWFERDTEGYLTRISILKQAIEETKN